MANQQQSASDRLGQLEQENAQLREQVRRLMAAENKLYMLQDHLSAQQRVYVQLAELGRSLTGMLDVDRITETVVKFVVYSLNYERCVAFLREPQDTAYRARAWEGYYESQALTRVSSAFLSDDDVAQLGIEEMGFVCCKGKPDAPGTDGVGSMVQLDEYFVFALPKKSGGVLGLLVAGNTREQARYQSEVAAEGEMLVAFSNLANHTATSVEHVRAFRALERERELLDQAVADRTRELSEALDIAQEAVRLKAQFLANVSHELRTPLNSIVNVPMALISDYVSLNVLVCGGCGARFQTDQEESVEACPDCGGTLSEATSVACVGDPSEHLRFLKLMQQQGTHLLSLVEDVLDFSRIEAGRMELRPTTVDVGEVISEVEATILGTGRVEQRRLIMPALAERVTVTADRIKFKQVLINLVGNAVKFTKSDGRIELSVQQEGDAGGSTRVLVVSVIDDGLGIPADQIDAIFESFRQVDGSHTRAVGGAGLGLAICRQLVEMHGGTITVTSQLGSGSTFRVTWPMEPVSSTVKVISSPPGTDSEPLQTNARLGFGRVVVVDDDPAQLSMARKLLEREGYEVVLVAKPEEAVDTIRRVQPRMVLLDVMMPNTNGLTILTQLRHDESLREVAIIVSTAFHYNRKKALELGALWLPKPWSSRTLSGEHIEGLVAAVAQGAGDRHQSRPKRLADSVSSILYVEDEDANWEVTQLSLRGKFQLTRARDAREAFTAIARGGFDLILMDIQLSGSDMNGIEIAQAVTGCNTGAADEPLPEYARGVTTASPIVFVTAYSAIYGRDELLASGGKELVVKPVDFTQLLLVVSRLLVQGTLERGS